MGLLYLLVAAVNSILSRFRCRIYTIYPTRT